MAKSLRSKSKRAFRRIKRESGVFAAADAARLHRVSAKLRAKLGTDQDGDVPLPPAEIVEEGVEGIQTEEGAAVATASEAPAQVPQDGKDLESSAEKKVTTSGHRLSRRDARRLGKRKPGRSAKHKGAKGKAGRSKRRR